MTNLVQYNLESALADAHSTFTELAEELCNWGDNIEEKFSQTQKYDDIRAAQETLEGLDKLEVPEALRSIQFQVKPLTAKRPSRPDRRNWAVALLDRAMAELMELIEKLEEREPEQLTEVEADQLAAANDLHSEIERVKDEAESVEFPRAFG